MSKQHLGRWVIVLFLLAALPGMTAVMAQGSATSDPGQLAAIPYVYTESEPNNSIATADAFKQVNAGMIQEPGDVDFYRLERPYIEDEMGTHQSVLIEVETEGFGGSRLAAVICLYKVDGWPETPFELACSEPSDTIHDSMIYYNLEMGHEYGMYPYYYVSVRAVNLNWGEPNNYRYQLLISYPLLISAAAGGLGTGNVAGIPFQSGDILAWSSFVVNNVTYERWVMLLDLSDLNIKGNITNIAAGWRNSDFLLIGFAANVTLPGGAGTIKPWDVAIFDPDQVGPSTRGTIRPWSSGAQLGLTTSAEKIDAVAWPEWYGPAGAQLYISTVGTATVPTTAGVGFKLPDEDIGLWKQLPAPGGWTRFQDGSTVAGMGAEDVIAFTYFRGCTNCSYHDYEDYSNLDMVIAGTARCGPEQVFLTQKDIFRHQWISFGTGDGDETQFRPCIRMWSGPDHGWNYNIDAFDYSGWTYK